MDFQIHSIFNVYSGVTHECVWINDMCQG